jgi:hypothetical protein
MLDSFPSGSYALSALLRLMDIAESDEVPTAAVECKLQPRLLINPGFVEKHAETPEKLLMLVMHELHHVLLGHTTLFPAVTKIQNFVFDCVINGLISRIFPDAEFTSFLTNYYSGKCFPECLLSPPPRWNGRYVGRLPGGILSLPRSARKAAAEVYRGLYSQGGATYQEVYEILPDLIGEEAAGAIPLLGGHRDGGAAKGGLEERSPVLFDVVRGIVEQWPQPPDPIRGRSLSDILREESVQLRRVPNNRAILRSLFRKIAGRSRGGAIHRKVLDPLLVPSPIPSFDRKSTVLRAIGIQPLFYSGSVPLRRRVPSGKKVHVYADVSGSMNGIKDALYGAILDSQEFVHPVLHLFSTRVSDISLSEMRKGRVRSTGGTDIACVARHMAKHGIRRACILTDGWVGKPRGRNRKTLLESRLAVAYAGDETNTADLEEVANHVANLRVEG